jgi:hypothetical protein
MDCPCGDWESALESMTERVRAVRRVNRCYQCGFSLAETEKRARGLFENTRRVEWSGKEWADVGKDVRLMYRRRARESLWYIMREQL